ncbi:hypothetical protein [Pelosinus sp. sgz500959]
MVKGMGKRAYHKRDMNQLNKTALRIGAVLAAVSLLAIIISFVR